MSSEHLVDGHRLSLLRNGEEYFPRLIQAMDGATRSIYLETYMYAADASGRAILEALLRAAGRGVRAHLLLDGFGCPDFPPDWAEELRAAGAQVQWFRPEIARLKLRRYRLRRLHRKLAVIDGRIAFVGGINIINDVPGGRIAAPRLDYAVEVQGDTVGHIHAAMRRLWLLVAWTHLRQQRDHEKFHFAPVAQQKITFLLCDNLRHRRDIELAYLNAIADAQREIIIANAYFLPGKRLRMAMLQAVQRGVRVVLLLQGQVEYRLQHYATLALYDELLHGGVEIQEYHASFLHAKVAVVDAYWVTVGSSNIDPFSLWLAREANLVVRDAGFALALRASLLNEMVQGAHPVAHVAWRKQGIWMRLLARASYAVVLFLTGVLGYARGRDD
jgi:cardiolipin synthase